MGEMRMRMLVFWLAWLAPLAYLAVIFVKQPADRLTGPEGSPLVRCRWLYDDYDTAAYAVRGLNAYLGRRPGRLAEPPAYYPRDFSALLLSSAPVVPAESRYFLEYPQAALWLFRLGYARPPRLSPANVPAALADGWHTNIVEHEPQTPMERYLWRKLRQAIRIYEAIGIACLVCMMVVIYRGYRRGETTWPAFLLLMPASLYFSANRFDALPALLSALALASLGRERPALSGALMAVATMIKLYPLLIGIVIIAAFWRRPRIVGIWLLAFLATAISLSALGIMESGWEAWLAPYRYQFGRTADSYGATFYGVLWPTSWVSAGGLGIGFRLGAVSLALVVAILSKPRDLDGVLRQGAVVLIIFIAVQTFYSPQWLLWLAPLLLPLARGNWTIGACYAALDLTTYLTFPIVADWPPGAFHDSCLSGLIYFRAIFLAGLLILLVQRQWRAG